MNVNRPLSKLFTCLALVSILLAGQIIFAQTIHVTTGENSTTILANDYSLLTLSNTVSTIKASKIKGDKNDFTQLEIDGYGYSNTIGYPRLPVLKKIIEVPQDASIEIVVTQKRFKDISLKEFSLYDRIIPAQASLSKSDDPETAIFVLNDSIYNLNDFVGQELVSIHESGVMRGIHLARLEIAPLQYNPMANTLRVYDNITVEIKYHNGNINQTLQDKQEKMNPFFSGINQMIFNYKKVETSDNIFSSQPITYIIVADSSFTEALQPFIQWKNRKGFRVIEAYTNDPEVGTTSSSIKNFLQTFYDNPPDGYQPQSFVLFVGDIAQIPAFSGTAGNHVTDLYYCEYTGDIFPEAYYGRFSANDLAQLQPQIDKTLEYEQYLFPDPTFLDEVVMVAGQDSYHQMTWGNGQVNYCNEYYFNESNGLYSHSYLQPEPPGGNYSQEIRQNVSDGVAFANYSAHCSAAGWANPSFTNLHISSLENQSKYPLMVGNCCSSLEFQINSFGEEIMRAEGKGAIGYIGGSNSTYWDEDFWWSVGFKEVTANPPYMPLSLGAMDRLFHSQPEITINDWHITQGQLVTAGNLAVTQSGSSLTNYYWEIYHLMGDPSLMVYFSQAPDGMADYPALIPPLSESVTVTTNPYAYAALTKNGQLHGAAFADENGVAEIVFFEPITEPGEAEIVITGQQLKPFFGTLLVASPNSAYVLTKEAGINDQLNGNGNNKMDYAETCALNLILQNYGQQPGSNIVLTLHSSSEFIEITNNTSTLESIQANELVSLTGVFEFNTQPEIPDGQNVSFILEATDGEEIWTSSFTLKAHAPQLEYSGYLLNDEQGNNNGNFDPGEAVQITIYVTNSGSSRAFGVTGDLTTSDSYITLATDPQFFGDAEPDEVISASFVLVADEQTPSGHPAFFDFNLSADHGISGFGQFNLTIGPIPVLIIDLDGNHNSADSIQQTITKMGIVSESTSSIPAELALYSSIFLSLGTYNTNYVLSPSEGQILADYLLNGGRLYIEGGDTWYYDPETPVHVLFGIHGLSDGAGDLDTITGVAGTPAENLQMKYTGDNNWIDQLEAVNGAQSLFKNLSPAYTCAVSKIGNGYKTIGTSFEFGGINDESARQSLMAVYLDFFEITIPASLLCNSWVLDNDICQGDTTQMYVDIIGGSGSFAIHWTPETGLNDPFIQNPLAFPEATTFYTVEVIDLLTNETVNHQLSIIVRAKPPAPVIIQSEQKLVSNAQYGNQWYNDDGLISGATGQVFSPPKTNNYYTIVTNAEGCTSDMSNVIFYQSTFIDELISQGSLRIYPNPSDGVVSIDFISESGEEHEVHVYNTFGQSISELITNIIKQPGYNTISVDMSTLPGGVYYFKFIEGNNLTTRKLILSK